MARIRVLYSFPHRLGMGRICYTAWEQVRGLAAAGAEVHVAPASVERELPAGVEARPTLARGRARVPFRVVGQQRALALHDRIVARRLPELAGEIDLVHTWPLGALETLRAAKRLGIPTVLERPNAHTRFAYEVVRAECERIGVPLPPDHEHAYNEDILRKEEAEYELADALLCPSDFVVQTFVDQGIPREKLVRHIYGYDEAVFHPAAERERPAVHGAVRRRRGRAQGTALRARGLAALAGLARRPLPDRRRGPFPPTRSGSTASSPIRAYARSVTGTT